MTNFFGYILFESKSKFSGFVLVLVQETQGLCININLQRIIKNAGFFSDLVLESGPSDGTLLKRSIGTPNKACF